MRRRWRELGLETPEDKGYIVEPRHKRKCGGGTPSDCVVTEIVAYLDSFGREIARAERHLRADGTIGASGKADPKRIRIDDKLYVLELRR
jgi:hypothetical protein